MKLYLSDLDGTLLNTEAEISDTTAQILNELIDDGMAFSVATARTAATVQDILKKINIKLPVILMNGVCIYDLKTRHYISACYIKKPARRFLIETMKAHDLEGYLYAVSDHQLQTMYEKAESAHAISFMNERIKKYGKVFTKVNDIKQCLETDLIYYSVSGKKDTLAPAWRSFSRCEDLHTEFYRDIYNTDHWYLEVSSSEASKYKAAEYLKTHYGFTYLVSFGDNLNDLPLFQASQEAYAMANAKEEVKKAASDVIGSNTEDGVARWLKQHAHD